ncbi:ferric iron uptake transcriptional regulator [Thiotrichales bacterium 19S9-12]|nr:ferric iron uptake transcriptional regulator [Thiotrichales bacterium 19S9-11]MCF6811107.1 ferric iron uptake transcriptional regulator [Thiotrichales bacterium 19S9-12]
MSKDKELKAAGLRVTQPRVKILQLLEASKGDCHFSAEDIHHQLQTQGEQVALATVYRVLSQFESVGLVSRLNLGDDQAVYELVSDCHHDHMVCVVCRKVEEFYDEVIEQRQKKIALSGGNQLVDHSLCLYVVCSQCQQKKLNK